jgi:hypothetical protein
VTGVYWICGKKYSVYGKAVGKGKYPELREKDVVTFVLDMDKELTMLRNGRRLDHWKNIPDRLWLVANLYGSGHSVSILKYQPSYSHNK